MTADVRQFMLDNMSEADFQALIIETAQRYGWLVAHFRPAQTHSGKWVTPVAADGKGFPDLVLARKGSVWFIEVKTMKGRVTPEQQAWIDELDSIDHRADVIRPSDFKWIRDWLRTGGQ